MTRRAQRHRAPKVETFSRRVLVAPTRDDLCDGGLLCVLAFLALIGFRTTYSGWMYLVAGLAGVVLGMLIGHLANVLRQPMIAVAAMTIAMFFLLGGAISLRAKAVAGVLPSAGTFDGLADESVHGWKHLLTTLPPVDGSGPLLVLPYLLGLLCGVGGFCLARRTRSSFAPAAAPTAVLVAVILLGVQSPAAHVLQGAVFGVLALGWAALRSHRLRPPVSSGTGRGVRWATVAALLVVSGTGATLAGPHVPGVGSQHRLVLRNYVHPPSNIDQFESPLTAFRTYVTPATSNPPGLRDTVLFTVSGLPANTPVRIATLDAYNATVWTASNEPAAPGRPVDSFQRVGSVIDNPATGRKVVFTVHIPAKGYSGVWLPDAGAVTGISFHGQHAASDETYFRYNLATGTGVLPGKLQAGDSYTVHATLPASTLPKDATPDTPDPALTAAATFVQQYATKLSGTANSPMARVLAIAQQLRDTGTYSDGLLPDQHGIWPGHSAWRIKTFLQGPQIVGDDEQYAAAFALMANQVGVPARVVLGAVPENGVVRGKDVHAWVEVQIADGSWRTIPTDQFMDSNRPPQKQPPQKEQQAQGHIVPPPVTSRPRSSLLDAAQANTKSTQKTKKAPPKAAAGFHLPWVVVATATWGGPPVGAIVLACALIVGLKALRRRRRRSRGSPAFRVVQGWREIVDHARDLGTTLPGGGTRREQGALLATLGVDPLARLADAHVFGPDDPADSVVGAYWQEITRARRQMSRSVGRWQRWRAAVSIASLRRAPRVVPEGRA
jgi:transglutaminase-like putative cysteine protease